MTKFQFVSDLLNIINALLEEGISGCTNHEARCYLDELFDRYEEYEGTSHADSSRGDLELYTHIVDNLQQRGYDLWKENEEQKAKMAKLPKKPKMPSEPFSTEKFFQRLNDMINVPFGEFESECDFMHTSKPDDQEIKMQTILDDIACKEKNMTPELENLTYDSSYIIWLDGGEDQGDLTDLPSDIDISIMSFEREVGV